jgi:hypothetical protein
MHNIIVKCSKGISFLYRISKFSSQYECVHNCIMTYKITCRILVTNMLGDIQIRDLEEVERMTLR